jgi:hypothetical protein
MHIYTFCNFTSSRADVIPTSEIRTTAVLVSLVVADCMIQRQALFSSGVMFTQKLIKIVTTPKWPMLASHDVGYKDY